MTNYKQVSSSKAPFCYEFSGPSNTWGIYIHLSGYTYIWGTLYNCSQERLHIYVAETSGLQDVFFLNTIDYG